MKYKLLLFLTIIFVLALGCNQDDDNKPKPNGNNIKRPGDWRWPETPDSEGIHYGEQMLIPGGTFEMGWRDGEPQPENTDGTRPTFQVTVSSFYLDKYEVTNAAFRDYVNQERPTDSLLIPDDFLLVPANELWYGDSVGHANYPVQPISWWAAVFYANWRSRLEGLDEAYQISGSNGNYQIVWDRTKNGYRLPTEAEWEFAARGGNLQRHYAWGNHYFYDTLRHIAYCSFYSNAYRNVWNIPESYATSIRIGKIGRFRPNNSPFGNGSGVWGNLDLNGNSDEWVWDWYGPYTNSPKINPTGPASGTEKVRRGGNAINSILRLYNYDRNRFRINSRASTGFRLARNYQ
ncbi:MAG: formylglycine-generating enzyme family protein [bacterium]|nr:formylglycine-generating enzyme family protein [bacterium]